MTFRRGAMRKEKTVVSNRLEWLQDRKGLGWLTFFVRKPILKSQPLLLVQFIACDRQRHRSQEHQKRETHTTQYNRLKANLKPGLHPTQHRPEKNVVDVHSIAISPDKA